MLPHPVIDAQIKRRTGKVLKNYGENYVSYIIPKFVGLPSA